MKDITSISFDFPSKSDFDYVSINSKSSLADSDIVIFRPKIGYNYSTDIDYQGKTLYTKSSSAKIYEFSDHWKTEIIDYLNSGKNIFIILCEKIDFMIYTGNVNVSGTGRSQKRSDVVAKYSNYQFLPTFGELDYIPSEGKSIIPLHSFAKSFLMAFKSFLDYKVYISDYNKSMMPYFSTKNKERVLGGILNSGKGSIIYLPNIEFNVDELKYYDEEEKDELWTEDAISLGENFLQQIIQLDKSLSQKDDKSQYPLWIKEKEFETKKTEGLKVKIKSLQTNKLHIEQQIDEVNSQLLDESSYLDLLFEQGSYLEDAVIKALKLLGYHVEGFDDGELELDQVIVSPEGNRYIGETEGKDNRDIDIEKFRQLTDSINEDFEKSEVEDKAYGLIFGNPKRLIDPKERGIGFTQKCIRGAERDRIGLIRTSDLFEICKYLLDNDDKKYKEKCRKAIHEQLGSVIEFPKSIKSKSERRKN